MKAGRVKDPSLVYYIQVPVTEGTARSAPTAEFV